MIGYLDGRTPTEVFATDDLLLEAPNWTLDSRWLVLNGAGRLWRLPADGGSGIEEIPLSDVPALNNDHVLAPDGERIYVSANDWHIYEASLLGGARSDITDVDPSGRMHFLHGVSPEDTHSPTSGWSRMTGTGGRRPCLLMPTPETECSADTRHRTR
jgi:hypothetical protein